MAKVSSTQKLFLTLVCSYSIFSVCGTPFGNHSEPGRGIDMIGKFSSPGVFYEHFIKPGVPLHFRSVLEEPEDVLPAFQKWTDDYLGDNFGETKFNVEGQKKENRNKKATKMSLNHFLKSYKTKPIYLIDSISKDMREDLSLPVTLQCGGSEKSVQDVVIWFSSGGTTSVLHKDPLNNLLCVLDGYKEVYFINKKYKSEVESDGFIQDGGYSNIDVDNVDKQKYKQLLSVPWFKATVRQGDCVFIPYGWYHFIKSGGRRNLAINYWLIHRWWFNHPSCINYEKFNISEPLIKYPMTSSNEMLRFQMLEPFKDLETVDKEEFLKPNVDKERREKLFNVINLDRDERLTWEELYEFDIDEVVKTYSDVLALDYIRSTNDLKKNTTINTKDEL